MSVNLCEECKAKYIDLDSIIKDAKEKKQNLMCIHYRDKILENIKKIKMGKK